MYFLIFLVNHVTGVNQLIPVVRSLINNTLNWWQSSHRETEVRWKILLLKYFSTSLDFASLSSNLTLDRENCEQYCQQSSASPVEWVKYSQVLITYTNYFRTGSDRSNPSVKSNPIRWVVVKEFMCKLMKKTIFILCQDKARAVQLWWGWMSRVCITAAVWRQDWCSLVQSISVSTVHIQRQLQAVSVNTSSQTISCRVMQYRRLVNMIKNI